MSLLPFNFTENVDKVYLLSNFEEYFAFAKHSLKDETWRTGVEGI
jgi:hypothetical protein